MDDHKHLASSNQGAFVTAPTTAQIADAIRVRTAAACDTGFWKRLTNIVLQPANPFEPRERRRTKREAVAILGVLAVVVALIVFFNVTAPGR